MSERAKVPIHVFDGCNHSLETEDALKNIEIIEKTMKITKEFIGDESGTYISEDMPSSDEKFIRK